MSTKHRTRTHYQMGCERPAEWRSVRRDSWCGVPGPALSLGAFVLLCLSFLWKVGWERSSDLMSPRYLWSGTGNFSPRTVKGFSSQKRYSEPALFRPRYSETYRETHRWKQMMAWILSALGGHRWQLGHEGPAVGMPAALQHGWQGRAASAQSAPKSRSLSAGRHSALIMKEMSLSKPSVPLHSATRYRGSDE